MDSIPIELVALGIGVFLCLFGYRLKKIAMTVIWFVIGFFLVSLFVDKIIDDQIWQLILCGVGGLVLSMFGLTIEKFAIFVTVGATFALTILQSFGPPTDWVLPAISIAVGVTAGAFATWLMKPMLILATALEGARLIAVYGISLAQLDYNQWYFPSLIGLTVIGVIFQARTCSKIH